MCEYVLPTNLQNFMQKDNQSENIPKSFRWATLFWNTLYTRPG